MRAQDETPYLSAAQAFLADEAWRAPDFSPCWVLVPHHHAALGFTQALRTALSAAEFPVFRPPRLMTLPDWGRSATSFQEDPPSRRLAELQDFLRRSGQIPEHSLWQASQELQALLEELDEWDTDLEAADYANWAQSRAHNTYLGLEASIALAVWRVFRQGTPGRARAQALRLQALAGQADRPLYTLGLDGLNPSEQASLDTWAKTHPVIPLPLPSPFELRKTLLEQVWSTQTPPLAERARTWARAQPASQLNQAIEIHPAHNLEMAARTAEHVLMTWLSQGHSRIALVALDRLLARRLRALLERRGILVQDETGWAFSTSAVSHVLERWLALVGGPARAPLVLDILKSPYFFANSPDERLAAAHGLASLLAKRLAPRTLSGFGDLAREAGLSEAAALLERLHQARAAFSTRRQSLASWLGQLRASLEHLEVAPALAQDPIGQQMLALLARLELESASFEQPYAFTEWRRWLFLHLEQETFRDTSVDSPIRLTHLGASVYRDMEGVLILGAGAQHLPGLARASIFNDATRSQLGLPTNAALAQKSQTQLATLLAWTPRAVFIWQDENEGDPAPLSPWLQQLEAFHAAAWDQSLMQPRLQSHLVTALTTLPTTAAPTLSNAPASMSVSDWQTLVSCPYRFFARRGLGLNQTDALAEEMDKSEYGTLVHDILARFHTENPILAQAPAAHWVELLMAISHETFRPRETQNLTATAWRVRWESHLPEYIAWAMAHETEGWRFHEAEKVLERDLTWGKEAGQQTRLHGRADRLDLKEESRAVLDYKTQSMATLNRKRKDPGEDIQLVTYAWLAQAERSGFVPLDQDKVKLLEPDLQGQTLDQRAQAEAERMAHTLADMAAGVALPAHGAPTTCAYCEMAGLCRRAHG